MVFKTEKKKFFFSDEFHDIFSNLLEVPLSLRTVNIHRDYHIDNLFYFSKASKIKRCGWIDHQDALKGTCVYDLMSLLEDARIDPDYLLNNKLISYYLDNFYEIDKTLFLQGCKIIAIQRHLKVLGIFSRLYLRDKKSDYLQYIPRVITMLEKNLNEKKFEDMRKIILHFLK